VIDGEHSRQKFGFIDPGKLFRQWEQKSSRFRKVLSKFSGVRQNAVSGSVSRPGR